ncbi:MAG TPA: threonine synthase [Gemmatimonadaceae bacterium]
MTTSIDLAAPASSDIPRALPQRCKLCGAEQDAAPVAICEHCLGPLEPLYPKDRALPDRATIESRAKSLWRYREFLPFSYGAADAGVRDGHLLSPDTGFTPLVDAPRLAARLGVARAWVKNDAVSHPTLSFKDRVVATAINAARSFGLDTVGCASTGNLANAVAAHAARAGMQAWIFIPEDLEEGKVIGTLVYGPNLVRIRGHYDDVNRLCAQLADRFGWGIVNVNLRGYYGEGSKTMAFEIAEQLGWRLPSAVVAPMAGGSLVTKLRKGFGEFIAAGLVEGASPRIYGAQASGCAPIVRLLESGGDKLVPEIPKTIARSIAIGNPADGPFAVKAMKESGGWAQSVSDEELVEGIRILAGTTGIFTETAGGVTVASALALAAKGHFKRDDEVVLCITGNGLKTTDAVRDVLPEAPVIDAKVREVAALVAARG